MTQARYLYLTGHGEAVPDESELSNRGPLAGWLGQTLARLHRLDHADPDPTLASDWFGLPHWFGLRMPGTKRASRSRRALNS